MLRWAVAAVAALAVAVAVFLVARPGEEAAPERPVVPRNAQTYATQLFEAWTQADLGRERFLTAPEALAVLTAHPARAGTTWTFTRCEGAAGSVYCTWTGRTQRVVLRVANQRAAAGEPHAVVEARWE